MDIYIVSTVTAGLPVSLTSSINYYEHSLRVDPIDISKYYKLKQTKVETIFNKELSRKKWTYV